MTSSRFLSVVPLFVVWTVTVVLSVPHPPGLELVTRRSEDTKSLHYRVTSWNCHQLIKGWGGVGGWRRTSSLYSTLHHFIPLPIYCTALPSGGRSVDKRREWGGVGGAELLHFIPLHFTLLHFTFSYTTLLYFAPRGGAQLNFPEWPLTALVLFRRSLRHCVHRWAGWPAAGRLSSWGPSRLPERGRSARTRSSRQAPENSSFLRLNKFTVENRRVSRSAPPC